MDTNPATKLPTGCKPRHISEELGEPLHFGGPMSISNGATQEVGEAVYEARPSRCHPGGKLAREGWIFDTFSVGIGPVGSRAAAIYRVAGETRDVEKVDRLVSRVVHWLNSRSRINLRPDQVLSLNDGSARTKLTPAGRRAGFLPVGAP